MSGISPPVKFSMMSENKELRASANMGINKELESTSKRSTPRRLSFNNATSKLKLSMGTVKPLLDKKNKASPPLKATLKPSHETAESFPIPFKLFPKLYSSTSSSSLVSIASNASTKSVLSAASTSSSPSTSSSSTSLNSSIASTSKSIHMSMDIDSSASSLTSLPSSSSSPHSGSRFNSSQSLTPTSTPMPVSGSLWPPTHFAASRSLEPKLHLKLPTLKAPAQKEGTSTPLTPLNMLVTIPLKRLASSTLATLPSESTFQTPSSGKKQKTLLISPPKSTRSSTPPTLPINHPKQVSDRAAKLRANGVHISSNPPPNTRRNTEPKAPKINQDYCEACRVHGSLLCCESCPRSFHLLCLNPPLDYGEAPEGAWYCQSCSIKRKNSIAPIPPIRSSDSLPKKVRHAFQSLLHQIHRSNPTSFHLPNYIIHSFDSLTSNVDGEFELTTFARNVKRRNGKVEPRDLFRLSLPDGTPVLCYACGGSSLHSKPILACDFCPLYFHLDCLDPPLVTAPSVHEKWKCPCHADWTLPNLKNTTKEKKYYRHGTMVTLPSDLDHVNENKCISGFLHKLHSELHPS